MGCTASKLDNEDTVRRCKERRRLMKEAVHARHHLAAAHSDYCHSLRRTGAALTTFAAGEPLAVADHTPAVFLHTPSTIKPPSHPTPPPPPTMRRPPPAPVRTSAVNHQQRRPKPTIKLPHILSESSETSSPNPRENPKIDQNEDYYYNPDKFTYIPQANYASTPSQASSVWNWESFYPPSPPDSEYFNQRKPNFDNENDDKSSIHSTNSSYKANWNNIHKSHAQNNEDKASIYSNFSQHNFNSNESDKKSSIHSTNTSYKENWNNIHMNHAQNNDDKASIYSNFSHKKTHHHHLETEDDGERQNNDDKASIYSNFSHKKTHHHHLETEDDGEREERECSEWGDHCSSSSSSDDEEIDGDSRSEIESRSNFGSSVHNESVAPPLSTFSSAAKPKFSPVSKSEKSDDTASSSARWKTGKFDDNSDMRMVVRHRDLAEIVGSIKEYFEKAAAAGDQVSEMLETGRAQLDRSFRQLKKTVYHSSGVFSNLSSSWTSKPPLAVKYRFEPSSLDEPGGSKSLCSTLDRLLAWEMKLYQEVKAREGVKIAHEKKLSVLQNQEYKGGEESKLDKTKASIKQLQSLIVVTSQAVSTTSTAIVGVRDTELVPQLVELCHGFMYMWRSMNQCHEIQNDVVQQVRGLVNQSTKGESTSDLHRQATRDLESAVSAWHSSFCRLIKFHRDFIRSLHGWFKLTLLPITTEELNLNKSEPSEAYLLFDEWKLALERLPDTVASEAIKSFIQVVRSISLKQAEELKVKKRTDSASKELERKSSSLRNIEKKYYHSYSMVGLGLPDNRPDHGHALDVRDPLSEKKSELAACQRRVEDEMLRHSKAVEVTRAMTLNNIQTGLPGVFQAMTSFSALIMESLDVVCHKSYAIR